jgi:hypothetical protein
MYTFLVLGLIPGTNIQIGFWTWIILMVGLSIIAYRLKPRIILYVGSWWRQFDEDSVTRKPLHANRLHLRGL